MKLQSQKEKNLKIILIVAIAVLLIGLVVFGVILVPDLVDKINSGNGDANTKIEIQEIVISSLPDTEYLVNESFNPTGLTIQVVTGNMDTTYFVEYPDKDLTITGFDSSNVNDALMLTVSYKGFTTTFPVVIKELDKPAPTLTSIRLSDNFCDTYSLDWWTRKGPVFDGVDLICTYSDESEKRIPMDSIYCDPINYDVSGATTVELTFRYTDAGVTVSGSATITITE